MANFNFKTKSGLTGSIEITNYPKCIGSIEGKTFDCEVGQVGNTVCFNVNLLDLNKLGLLNAPKVIQNVNIEIIDVKNLGEMLDRINSIVRVKAESGRIGTSAMFYTNSQISEMSYTEQVIAGFYKE